MQKYFGRYGKIIANFNSQNMEYMNQSIKIMICLYVRRYFKNIDLYLYISLSLSLSLSLFLFIHPRFLFPLGFSSVVVSSFVIDSTRASMNRSLNNSPPPFFLPSFYVVFRFDASFTEFYRVLPSFSSVLT